MASPAAPFTKTMRPYTVGISIWVSATGDLGLFEKSGDVGVVLHPGSAKFDPAAKSYTVSGSGENMWFAKDALHFVWKKMDGDVSIAADIAFEGTGKDPHRKACLMIRQGLETDAAYVDVAVHGEVGMDYGRAGGECCFHVGDGGEWFVVNRNSADGIFSDGAG